MKRLVRYILLVGLAFSLACSSGKQDLQRGNYESSMRKAIDRLRSSPDNKKAQETLRNAYPLALNYHKDKVANLKTANKAFKWESILSSYLKLNAMYEDLQRCPSCLQVVPNPENFTAEAEAARDEAAEERYQAGTIALDLHERTAAQRAYRHFKKVESLRRNYKDNAIKMTEALREATLKVVVERVPDVFDQDLRVGYFNDKLVEYLRINKKPNEFVEFYAAQEAIDANLQKPDHYVMMNFQNITTGNPQIKESTVEAAKDSVIIGQVEVDGEKRNVYGTVTAKVTIYEKTLRVGGTLNMQIVDAYSNQAKLQETYPSEYIWTNRWGNFNGDERALTNEQLEICNQKETPIPQKEQLFIDFSKPVFEQVTRRLSSYYRNM